MNKYFTYIIALMLLCSCAQRNVSFAYKPIEDGRICIPVEINGKEKLFLFDTGSQVTLMNYPVMKDCGIQLEDSVYQTIYTVYDSIADMTHYSNTRLSIGGMSFNCAMFADRYNRAIFKKMDYDKYDGILGVKDIQKFNWLFNFEDKKVTISKDPIDLLMAPDDLVLNLYFSKRQKNITYVDLVLNDSIEHLFLFDTGYANAIRMDVENRQHVKLNGDFVLTPSLKEYINKRIPSCISIAESTLLINSLKINDLQLSYLASQRDNESIISDNVITKNFLRRFRLMYYDSTNKKISLYVSPKDTTVYRGENEKKVIDAIISAILKQAEGNVGGKITGTLDSLKIP